MDRNGYRRAAAVRRIGAFGDPLAGSFLALRTVDWVEPVADIARSELIDRIRTDPEAAALSAPLVFALEGRARAVPMIEALLEAAANSPPLLRRLVASPEARTRRRILDVALAGGALTLDELVALAIGDRDSVVATQAGQAASAAARAKRSDIALARLLRGPAAVRAAALEALPPGVDRLAIGERHLFDRSPLVRRAAQTAFRRVGGDAAAAYRQSLGDETRLAVAVIELGHLGGPEDMAAIDAALTSPLARVRRAAVEATRWRSGPQLPSLLAPLLADRSPGVTRAVARRLRPFAAALDRSFLLALATSPEFHVRRAAVALLRRRSLVDRLEADFVALADADERIRSVAQTDLRSWLDRGAASAPRADRATRIRLGRAFDVVAAALESGVAAQIRFHAGLRPQDLETG